MKKNRSFLFALAIIAALTIQYADAQSTITYDAAQFGVKFELPSLWLTTEYSKAPVPYLESANPEKSMTFFLKKVVNGSSAEVLLQSELRTLGLKTSVEASVEKIGDTEALVAQGNGSINQRQTEMIVTALRLNNQWYILRASTDESRFPTNGETLRAIIMSVRPNR